MNWTRRLLVKPASRKALFLAALIPLAVFAYRRTKDPSRFFPRAGKSTLSTAEINARIERLNDRLARSPEDLTARVDAGVLHFLLGPDHYADALNAFNEAWLDGAFDERIFYYSGILYENLSLPEEAERQYERFLKHEPGDREVQMRLARLLFRMGRWERSVAAYEDVLRQDPKDVTALVSLGTAYRQIYESRRKTKAGKKSPPPPADEAQFRDRAVESLEKAVQAGSPPPPGVRGALAHLYAEKEQWEKSLESARAELAQGDDRDLRFLVLASLEKLNRRDEALDWAQKLLEQDPKNRALKQKIRSWKAASKKS